MLTAKPRRADIDASAASTLRGLRGKSVPTGSASCRELPRRLAPNALGFDDIRSQVNPLSRSLLKDGAGALV
ncbi:hypothetical protein [Bradyrhizobium hipponense]|uniref:hypothetical protein n=1 Tax=Bradyrhizobium hipponense TaxID=2605638 RepID=UPI001652F1CB|nr:hypothetical protein [Bradyrhizobium hipponense]